MAHQFTIESEEAFALATELAALTGQSLETVVVQAVRQQLDAERTLRAKFDRVMALAAEFRATLTEPMLSTDLHELCDDTTGLPI